MNDNSCNHFTGLWFIYISSKVSLTSLCILYLKESQKDRGCGDNIFPLGNKVGVHYDIM